MTLVEEIQSFRKANKEESKEIKRLNELNEFLEEDFCNDTYGYIRMKQALDLVNKGESSIPSERTVYRIMTKGKLIHRPKRKPNGITKADKQARKSDDLIKRDFSAEEPLRKCVTDITEIPAKDGKLYVSCIFDCFDNAVLGISMANNMKAALCSQTLKNAFTSYPELAGAIVHSDRGSQYTSGVYRHEIAKIGIRQSMNSAGGRCHDNAKCESFWGRMKEELLYGDFLQTPDEVVQLLLQHHQLFYYQCVLSNKNWLISQLY